MFITALVIEQSALLSVGPPPVLAGAGLFDRVDSLSANALQTLKVVGVVVGLFVAISGIVRARGAIGGTIVSILVGAVIGWGVYNIDNASLRSEIGSDLTGAPASAPAWTDPSSSTALLPSSDPASATSSSA